MGEAPCPGVEVGNLEEYCAAELIGCQPHARVSNPEQQKREKDPT